MNVENRIYTKTITTKITEKQYTCLQEHAKHRNMDFSSLIRHMIDNLNNNNAEILEHIQFHEYSIAQLQKKLQKKTEENKQTEDVQNKKKEEEDRKKQQEEIATKVGRFFQKEIWMPLILKYDDLLISMEEKDKPKKEKIIADVMMFIQEKYNKSDVEIRANLKQHIIKLFERSCGIIVRLE